VAKILGGNASRLEVYALFVAAVVLIGGGISGAIVVTSSDSKPAEVAQVSVDATVAPTTTPVTAPWMTTPATTAPAGQPGVAGSTSATITVPGLTAEQAETLRQQIQRQQDAEAAAAVASAYAAANPVGRVRDLLYTTCYMGQPMSMLRWVYLGEYPAPNGIEVTVSFNGRSSTASPNAMSGDASHKTFQLGSELAPAPRNLVTYEIKTTGPEGAIRGTITPTVVDCDGYVE